MPAEAKPYGYAAYFVLLSAYLSLNSLLNLMNKWALSWFSFPLLLTASHMGFAFIFLMPIVLFGSDKAKQMALLRRQWKGFLFVGLFLGLNVSLNNSALTGMTLSLNQVIRASLPVCTCLMSMLFQRIFPTVSEAGALIILVLGAMIAAWKNNAGGSSWAILLCIAGTISNAGMMSLSGKVLDEKVDALQLTFYTAPVSFLAIIPAFIHKELGLFLLYRKHNNSQSMAIIFGTSAIALVYNIVHALMIQQTSAVTTTVIGQAKILGLLFFSAMLLGEKKTFTVKMTIGTIVSLLGFFLYSMLKLRQKLKVKQSTSEAVVATPSGKV